MQRAAEIVWKVNFILFFIKLCQYFDCDDRFTKSKKKHSCHIYTKKCVDEFIETHINETVEETYDSALNEFCCKEYELYYA